MFDHKAARKDLEILYDAVSSLKGRYDEQIRKFIDVGEYDLALDGIADTYIINNVSMPLVLFRVFDKLATDMDLASDPEFSAVAELRKTQATSV